MNPPWTSARCKIRAISPHIQLHTCFSRPHRCIRQEGKTCGPPALEPHPILYDRMRGMFVHAPPSLRQLKAASISGKGRQKVKVCGLLTSARSASRTHRSMQEARRKLTGPRVSCGDVRRCCSRSCLALRLARLALRSSGLSGSSLHPLRPLRCHCSLARGAPTRTNRKRTKTKTNVNRDG